MFEIMRTNLTGKLGLPELAEGVETDAQPALFAAEGCNEVLGYLIGDRSRLFASTCQEWLECQVSRTS